MFADVVAASFEPAIENGPPYPGGLRIKGVRGADGVWEMTWDGDGRATFEFGPQVLPGKPHVVWRRVGGHEIFGDP